jgi:hypothetical protein
MQMTFDGDITSFGTFAVVVPDNNAITPSGTQWRVRVAPASTSPPSEIILPITGPIRDITTELNNAIPPISVSVDPSPASRPLARAYNDAEIDEPIWGTIYYNLNDGLLHYFDGTNWQLLTTGGSSIVPPWVNNLLISSSNVFGNPAPGQPILTYTLVNSVAFSDNYASPPSRGSVSIPPATQTTFNIVRYSPGSGGATIPSGNVLFNTDGTVTFTGMAFIAGVGWRIQINAPLTMDPNMTDPAVTLVGTILS